MQSRSLTAALAFMIHDLEFMTHDQRHVRVW